MASPLAMYVKTPNIDLGQIAGTAADLRQADANLRRTNIDSSLAEYDLRDTASQSNAVRDYRTALKAGDKNASDALAGYPELQAKFAEAFKKLAPDKKAAAAARARALAEDARMIGTLPAGSPEQAQAWERIVRKNAALGYISKEQAQSALSSGPSDLLIQQAITAEQWVDAALDDDDGKEMSPKDIEKHLIDYRKAITPDTTYNRLDEDSKVEIDRAVNMERARLEAGNSRKKGGSSNYRSPTLSLAPRGRGFESKPDVFSPEPMENQGGIRRPQTPATHINAPTPRTEEEFDALPSGTPFINPADGQFLWKP